MGELKMGLGCKTVKAHPQGRVSFSKALAVQSSATNRVRVSLWGLALIPTPTVGKGCAMSLVNFQGSPWWYERTN